MKKFLLFTIAAAISLTGIAQGNGKNKVKTKTEVRGNGQSKKVKTEGHVDVNDNVNDNVSRSVKVKKSGQQTQGGNSKNQPAKVREAFYNDYPNATNVVWNKYRGDWTATFNNGITRSTAVYHANGQRRDTRTDISRTQLPGTIWDRVFQRDNVNPVGVTQIESPKLGPIFRIKSRNTTGTTQYRYYNSNGELVQYNY